MKKCQQVNKITSQRANINCTLSIVNCKLFSLLSLVIILLIPAKIFAQKDIKLDIAVPEKWQIDSIYLTNNIIYNEWWHKFNDTTLDSLMTVALNNNYSLQAVENTLEKSHLALQKSKGAFYPTVGIDAQLKAA